jgi:putative phosphoribosyl transferase
MLRSFESEANAFQHTTLCLATFVMKSIQFMTADPSTGNPDELSSQAVIVPTKHMAKFADLASAGRDLVAQLPGNLGIEETVVVAIARGGVPVALEVADRLGSPLDIILIRRLFAPRDPSSQLCAVNVCGTLVIDQELELPSNPPQTPVEYFVADALEELARRERTCRGDRAPLEVASKNVLLIDNGIHTGSTVRVATRALRRMNPSRVIVAVPVAALSARADIEAAADDLVCLVWPEAFGHVGLWYSSFNVPNEEQIRKMLDQGTRQSGS